MKTISLKVVRSLLAAIALVATVTTLHAGPAHKECLVYFGTFTGGGGKGIYFSHLDQETGNLTPPILAVEASNPGFLAIAPDGKHLFATGASTKLNGKNTGAAEAFAIDPATGNLSSLNVASTVGQGPCHIILDQAAKNVLVANYGSGSVAALPVQADGRLGEATSFIQHEGRSVNKDRQTGPHAHGFALDKSGKHAYACDLGTDKVMIYQFDSDKGTLTINDPSFFSVKPGSGPRHITFNPSGKYAYIVNEMASTVTAASHDEATGKLTELQTINMLPPEFTGMNTAAEIAVHPSGMFVYASNRGDNSIAAYSVDVKTGLLTSLGQTPTEGNTPRGFGIDPSGRWLICGNMDTGNVTVFRINLHSGLLKYTGQSFPCPSPVCVQFLPVKQ